MGKKKYLEETIVYSTDPHWKPEQDNYPPETPAPVLQKLTVRTDTKHRSGKIVTVIEGFVGNPEDLDNLSKILKNKCGTGGSVKNGVILIQGDCRQKIADILQKSGYKIRIVAR
jgi:translation initiation factor 1 (eIF-1/SUI1)